VHKLLLVEKQIVFFYVHYDLDGSEFSSAWVTTEEDEKLEHL